MSWLDKFVSWFIVRDPLLEAGERAAREAERMWALDVYDPRKGETSAAAKKSLAVIQDIVNRAGWTWVTYTGNNDTQWCGHFAAACWRTAGIDPSWLATFWASTLRLASWVRYLKWNDKSGGVRPAQGGRMLLAVDRATAPEALVFADGTRPRRGDIVIVGDGTPKEGDHINVLVGFSAERGTFHTISGNGGGLGPDGKRREGIVKKDYTASATSGYRVLFVIRPGVSDLLASH